MKTADLPLQRSQAVKGLLHRPRELERDLMLAYARLDALSPAPRSAAPRTCAVQSGTYTDTTAIVALRRAEVDKTIRELSARLNETRAQCRALVSLLGDATLRDIITSADLEGERADSICSRLYMDERSYYRLLQKARSLLYAPAVERGLLKTENAS